MTLYQKSAWFTAATIAVFCCMVCFQYGRMTASTITLRSGCDLSVSERDGLKPAWYLSGVRS